MQFNFVANKSVMPQSIPKPLEYQNALGFVEHDFFCIKTYKNAAPIGINSIGKIRLMKIKNAIINTFSLIASFLLLAVLFLFQIHFFEIKLALSLVSGLCLLIAFLYQQYSYKVIIVTKDFKTISIKIDFSERAEAFEIIEAIRKKIAK